MRLLEGSRLYGVGPDGDWGDLGEVISIALARANILTPGYTELYVNLGTDLDEAIAASTVTADWAEGVAAALPRSRKERPLATILAISEKAILAKASVDHLDKRAIRRAFASLRATKIFEVKLLRAVQITNLRTGGVSNRVLRPISAFDYLAAFGKLVFKGDELELRGRRGVLADDARKANKWPRVQRFALP
ncbi:MAG TPA: hypothetical protein VM261_22115 [Kofleriaceae bacterium]|nr:hypothetical protein [Kofleriaceae bacterium]